MYSFTHYMWIKGSLCVLGFLAGCSIEFLYVGAASLALSPIMFFAEREIA